MWLALTLKKQAVVSVLGNEVTVPFSDMADGCVGVCLAFDTKQHAAEYAGIGKYLVEIEEVPK